MKRLPSSEWLIVQPALSDLADYLRGELELAAKLDTEFFPDGVPDELPEEVDGAVL